MVRCTAPGLRSGGEAAATPLISRWPDTDAVICASDRVARGALDALRDLGRSAPDDVAVTGRDDWRILVTGARPRLTSISMDLEDLGRLGVTLLREVIGGRPSRGLENLACRFVARGSAVGRPRPSIDEGVAAFAVCRARSRTGLSAAAARIGSPP